MQEQKSLISRSNSINPRISQIRRAIDSDLYPAPEQTGVNHIRGTFIGVLSPSFGNIMNIIYFTRLPYIVGIAGGLPTIIGIVTGLIIVFITMSSLSAIATNGELESGGSYYLISRTVGPAMGAACGFCLAFASLFGAATSNLGLAEAIVLLYRSKFLIFNELWDMRIISTILTLIIGYTSQFGFEIRAIMFFRGYIRNFFILYRSIISNFNISKSIFKLFF